MPFHRSEQAIIGSFRGIPGDYDRSREERVETLDQAIARILERALPREDSVEQQLMSRWRDLLGPKLAERSHPERILPDGTLVIRSTTATVRQELVFESPAIIRCLGTVLPSAGIRRIRIQ